MSSDSLRALLLRRAARDAQAIVAEAQADAEGMRAAAAAQARTMVQAATREGEAAARHESVLGLRAARRQARAGVLAAQRAAEERLRRDAVGAAMGLRQERAYPALLDALQRIARRRLGEDAIVVVDPPGRGGVLARADTRTLDLTLASLALQALDAGAETDTAERAVA